MTATPKTPEEIRAEVRRHYGERIQGALAAADSDESTQTSCCPPAGGAETATSTVDSSCCGTSEATVEDEQIANVAKLYASDEVEDLPATVKDVAFGCGNPTAISALQRGQTVLDLGSGGGIDVFLAAKMVGAEGHVFGVDMTPDMIELARRNAEKVRATNVEFRLGEIEHLPMDSESVDVVISNCVINLSPDKDQVFREAFRVLRPGGRLQVSDIVWTKAVPESVKNDMEQWAGCMAGALVEADYLAKIRAAGFVDVTSEAVEYEQGRGVASAAVVAVKP